jgi:hypothetical protein
MCTSKDRSESEKRPPERVRKAAGVDYRWHGLRHTFITRLAENPNVSEKLSGRLRDMLADGYWRVQSHPDAVATGRERRKRRSAPSNDLNLLTRASRGVQLSTRISPYQTKGQGDAIDAPERLWTTARSCVTVVS